MTILIILTALFVLLLIGVPVAFALGAVGLAMLIAGGFSPLLAPQTILSTLDEFILLAVPLFLLMSNVLLKGGVGRDLFAAVQAWVGHWPGGLAVATIFSCAIFAAISGSSVATAATIGTVAIPEMIARGYRPRFVYGLLAAGGTLGILIPPSIPMIVYGFITEESVIALFLAGIVPGLLLVAAFTAYAMIHARFALDRQAIRAATWPERRRTSMRAFPSVLLAAFIIGGLYSGVFTPTEAAAVGFASALVITIAVLRTLTWQGFKEAAFESMVTTVAILLIIGGAKIFGKAIALYRIPQDISAFIGANIDGPILFILVVSIVLLLMGLVFEALSMVLIMVPVLLPAALALGFDPIWFGVYVVIMVECALITPPVGLNLYVIQSVARTTLGEVSRGVLPFLLILLASIVALYLVPDLALFVPFKW
ncbi:MAG: TRAP transporter large permease subunit [Alphaproteobacteria bacterium]|nr:TRAP transporter large permease subunit [Alphaproteobacteria bacterium]